MKHARVHRNNDYYMNATMRKLRMQLQGEHRKFFLQKNTISLNALEIMSHRAHKA